MGEPDDGKLSSPVRWGAFRKGVASKEAKTSLDAYPTQFSLKLRGKSKENNFQIKKKYANCRNRKTAF